MNKYVFNARDIAAYLKWFNVPGYLEVTYLQYFFSIGKKILAEPLTRDFEKFKSEVYRELYYLWANGFEDDKSDISKMPIEYYENPVKMYNPELAAKFNVAIPDDFVAIEG